MSRRLALVMLAGALTLAGCSDDGSANGDDIASDDAASAALRVGRFDFDESVLLAELFAQALEEAGVPVHRVDTPASREVLGPALQQGQIDLLPEYLGTASVFFGFDGASDQPPTVEDLRALVAPSGLIALEPASAENTNVFVVPSESGLGPRVSDLADVAAELRFGGHPECADRPLCLKGLEDRYGLTFARFVPQRSTALTAEALRRDEIDVGLMFSTDAALTGEFLVLEDDLDLQPPENIVPLVRREALERWGEPVVRAALARVTAALDTDALRTLNGRVASGIAGAVVVADWLASLDGSSTAG